MKQVLLVGRSVTVYYFKNYTIIIDHVGQSFLAINFCNIVSAEYVRLFFV